MADPDQAQRKADDPTDDSMTELVEIDAIMACDKTNYLAREGKKALHQ